MSDKQIETAIEDLLQNQTNLTKNLPVFQRLNVMLQKSETFAFEKNIHKLIISFLKIKNPELQSSALRILITCLQKGLFKSKQDLDIAYVVVDIAFNTTVDDVEQQELWLKAYSALEVMDNLQNELYKTRTFEMVKIIQKVIGSVSSSLQKLSALQMLKSLMITADLDLNTDTIQDTLLAMWIEQICPMIFNMNQPNLQTCALEVSNSSLLYLQKIFNKENQRHKNFANDITQIYRPVLINLVTNENCLYSKLWIFLTKLLEARFHHNFQMVNLLLQIVETGFKSQNIEVRVHAFYCWQSLIEGFTMNPTTFITEKRIHLLVLPLKANNGKTESLVEVKFLTWCKLINALHIKQINFKIVIAQYLNFCFGPLCEQALISWSTHGTAQISQGKKFSGIHLMSCKAFLQLFGIRKYIDEELNSKLKYFDFECPKIDVEDCSKFSKLIVDSVGECCVMLSQLQNADRFECASVNEALWKSLFYSVDSLTDENLKQTYTEEISALILALAGVARKRSSLITFGLVPLFNILTSGEFKFFKNEKMTELLFIPMVQAVMKKDKALLQHDVILIFKKIFEYKRNEKKFLKFVQMILERNYVVMKENIIPEKLTMLHNIWFLLEEELKNYLHNTLKSNIDEELYTSSFCEFFVWPVSILRSNFNQEKLSTKWKELYDLYGQCTSAALQNKLAVRIMLNLKKILARGSHVTSVAEITQFIVINLKLTDYEENSADICAVFSLLNTFLIMENINNESLQIFQKCVQIIFSSSQNLIHYPFCLSDPMLDCLNCLLSRHKNTDILKDVYDFVQSFKYDGKFISTFEKLMATLQTSGVEKVLIEQILIKLSSLMYDQKDLPSSSNIDLASSEVKVKAKKSPNIFRIQKLKAISDTEVNVKKRGRKSLFKCKESPEMGNESTSINHKVDVIDKKIEQSEKQQIVTLLGHDIDTMTPAVEKKQKLNDDGDQVLVVNTSYKFDPKKLTKSQREKLSKRRDDIPAMYEDLSQSQTRDFSSNSNSILESHKTDESQTKDENKLERSSNPFSELISNETETEEKITVTTDTTNETQPKTNYILPKTTESQLEVSDIALPTVAIQAQIKRRGRRKSVNIARVDEYPKRNIDNIISENSKDFTTELNSIENMKKEKSGKRKRKSISECTDTIESDINPLNTAHLVINSSDLLNSRDMENVLLKTDKRRKGRKVKLDIRSESDIESVSRPAKVSRGRRKSTGSVKKTEENSQSTADNEILSVLDEDKRQQRVNRELQRIKMDIKHSEEFYKNEKRKTRMSTSFHTFLEGEEGVVKQRKSSSPNNSQQVDIEHCYNKSVSKNLFSKFDESSSENSSSQNFEETTSNSTESEPIIESSQEPELEINLKQCKIPVLYPLEEVKPGEQISLDTGSSKMDVVKGPDPTSPFKILETISVPPKSSTCKQIMFSPENSSDIIPESENRSPPKRKIEILSNIIIRTPLKELEKFKVNDTETESITSEIIAEINAENPEMSISKPDNTDLLSRKVILDNSLTENSEESEENLLSPVPREQNSDIATSPVSTDTPTRNKELLRNTSEISPIKNLNFDDDTIFAGNDQVETVQTEKESNMIISTEILISEPSTSGFKLDFETEKMKQNSSHAVKVYSRKKNSLKPGGRSAQMMDLISAKTTSLLSSTKPKKSKEPKVLDSFFSPTQNRIMKMMGQLEKNDHQEQSSEERETDQIKDEDILTFSKNLPSPFASPSYGILKKRKISEDADETAIRACKRRRVNFSDPPVSCRKFIEKNTRHKYSASLKFDSIPQEPRITRSSKGSDDDVIENTDSLADDTAENPTIENCFIMSVIDTPGNSNNCKSDLEAIDNSNNTDDIITTSIPDEFENSEKETTTDETESLILYTPQKQNGDYQKSCEVSVITKNNDNSVKNSESLFSESLPNAQEFVADMPSTSRSTSESVLKWSPSKVKHSILNEEILGKTIKTVIRSIMDILNEKKLEAQPLVKLLLSDHNKISNILIKDVIKFIAKKFNQNPIEILKHLDSKSVCQSLLELASKSESSELIQLNLSEMFTSIINNPNNFVSFLSKLNTVELSGVVIRRMETRDDMSEFLKQIYDSVPYELPVPKELLHKEESKEESDGQIVENIIEKMETGNLSEELITSVLTTAMKHMNCEKICSLLFNEMKRRASP